MNTTKMHCRLFHTDGQLEKYIESNSITREEIFSITGFSSYRGNGNYDLYHYLYFFTARQLLVEPFTKLSETRQKEIELKLKSILIDKELKKALSDLPRKPKSHSGRLYSQNDFGKTLKMYHSILVFHAEIITEPQYDLEWVKVLIELNPNLIEVNDFI